MPPTQTNPRTDQPLYGQQTTLSLSNFAAPGRTLGDVPVFVRNYALVKLCRRPGQNSLCARRARLRAM